MKEKPLDKIINDGGMMNIFRNVGCIGDSLSSGAFEYDDEFRKKYFCGDHMNAMGYLVSAYYIMTYIDWIIRNNADDFKYVQFIGTIFKACKNN